MVSLRSTHLLAGAGILLLLSACGGPLGAEPPAFSEVGESVADAPRYDACVSTDDEDEAMRDEVDRVVAESRADIDAALRANVTNADEVEADEGSDDAMQSDDAATEAASEAFQQSIRDDRARGKFPGYIEIRAGDY